MEMLDGVCAYFVYTVRESGMGSARLRYQCSTLDMIATATLDRIAILSSCQRGWQGLGI